MKKKPIVSKAFVRGFWSGLAVVGSEHSPRTYVVAKATNRDAMRSDWLKIGTDFQRAAGRLHGKAESKD